MLHLIETVLEAKILVWPEGDYADETFRNYVSNAEIPLASGAQRFERLKQDILVRIMSIEAEDPTDSDIQDFATREGQTDLLDLNAAVGCH